MFVKPTHVSVGIVRLRILRGGGVVKKVVQFLGSKCLDAARLRDRRDSLGSCTVSSPCSIYTAAVEFHGDLDLMQVCGIDR